MNKDIRDEIDDVLNPLDDVDKQEYKKIGIEKETIQKIDKDNYEIGGTIKTTGKNVLVRINVTSRELDVEIDRSDDEIIDDFTENFATHLVFIYSGNKLNTLNLEKLVLSDGNTNNFVSNRINDKEDIKKRIKEAILRLKETKKIIIDNLKNYQSQEAYFDTILFIIEHGVGSERTRDIDFDVLTSYNVKKIKEENINYSSVSKSRLIDMLKERRKEQPLRYGEILKNMKHYDISLEHNYPKFKETVLWKIFNDANSTWLNSTWFGGKPKKSKTKKSKKAKKSKKSKNTRKSKK
jgi:hypothetical protein